MAAEASSASTREFSPEKKLEMSAENLHRANLENGASAPACERAEFREVEVPVEVLAKPVGPHGGNW